MTDQAKISALAAELTRLGKMPTWIKAIELRTWAIFEDGTTETVLREDAVLAALSGVAAEVVAEEWSISKEGDNWVARHWTSGVRKEPTYHEALLAALKLHDKRPRLRWLDPIGAEIPR